MSALKKNKHKYNVFFKKFDPSYNVSKKYIRWLNDKSVTKFTKIKATKKKIDIKKYIKKNDGINSFLFKITVKKKNYCLHVGNVRFYIKNNFATIALIIGEKKYHNYGIGTQVIAKGVQFLKKKKIKEICAYINKKNPTSLKAFKKNNFVKVSVDLFKNKPYNLFKYKRN